MKLLGIFILLLVSCGSDPLQKPDSAPKPAIENHFLNAVAMNLPGHWIGSSCDWEESEQKFLRYQIIIEPGRFEYRIQYYPNSACENSIEKEMIRSGSYTLEASAISRSLILFKAELDPKLFMLTKGLREEYPVVPGTKDGVSWEEQKGQMRVGVPVRILNGLLFLGHGTENFSSSYRRESP